MVDTVEIFLSSSLIMVVSYCVCGYVRGQFGGRLGLTSLGWGMATHKHAHGPHCLGMGHSYPHKHARGPHFLGMGAWLPLETRPWAALHWDEGVATPRNTPVGCTSLGWGVATPRNTPVVPLHWDGGVATPRNTPVGPTSLGWGRRYP